MLSGSIVCRMIGISIFFLWIQNNNVMDFASSLKQPKDRNLARRTAFAFTFAGPAKVAIVNLNLS